MLETDTIRIPKPQCLKAGSAYLVLSGLNWAVGDPILGGDGALSGSNALSHQQQRFWLETKQHYWFHAPNQYLDSRLGRILYPTPLGYQFQRALQGRAFSSTGTLISGYPSTAGTPTSTPP